MIHTLTPAQLVRQHLNDVLDNLPRSFDGDPESVHRARVATRRLREVLPLIDVPELEHVKASVRTAGQHLGRVRELDVMSSLLDSMGDRIPTMAAAEWHALRQRVRVRLEVERRAMIKALERLDLGALRDLLAPTFASTLARWMPTAYVVRPKWADSIWTRIVDRSEEAVAATNRAPAVYFPNRTHRVRIAVKKLRYAIDVAAATGVWRPRRVMKDLRKMQAILGELHDVQVLADFVADSSSPDATPSTGQPIIRDLAAADIHRHVAEYAKRRESILQMADACRQAASRARRRIPRRLVAVSVLTAPLLVDQVVRSQRRV